MGDLVYHEGVKCMASDEEIIGPRYYTKSRVMSDELKVLNYSEESFFKIQESDIDPLIFIRLGKSLENDAPALPEIDISKFYQKTDSYGIEIDIKPVYKTDISQQLISFAGQIHETKTKLLAPFD